MTDAAFHILGAENDSRWLFTCDHATNRVPVCIGGGSLGIAPADMERHIAYDIGIAGVTRRLAERMGAPAILSDFSRLVIDPYREACKTSTDIGQGRIELETPFLVTGFDEAPSEVRDGVAAGLAEKCEVKVSYAIGVAEPTSVNVETFGTAKVDEDRISALVREHFDLRPRGIIRMLDLLRPIYAQTAAYGHFGREEPHFTWERTDKAEQLRDDAGLR